MLRARHPLPAVLDIGSNLALLFERLADTFTPRKDLEPFRLPAKPPLIKDLFPSFEENDELLDFCEIFDRLNPETLLGLSWSGACGLAGYWAAYVAVLRKGQRLYLDLTWDDGPQVLAVGPPDFTRYTDLRFLRLLAASNGRQFGTGVIGSAPSSVSSDCVTSRDFLVDLFLEAFDASDAWESESLAACTDPGNGGQDDADTPDHDSEPPPLVIPAGPLLSPEDTVLYRRLAQDRDAIRWERDADVRTVERWLADAWFR